MENPISEDSPINALNLLIANILTPYQVSQEMKRHALYFRRTILRIIFQVTIFLDHIIFGKMKWHLNIPIIFRLIRVYTNSAIIEVLNFRYEILYKICGTLLYNKPRQKYRRASTNIAIIALTLKLKLSDVPQHSFRIVLT